MRQFVEHLAVKVLHQLLDILLDVVQYALHVRTPRYETHRGLLERRYPWIILLLDVGGAAGLQISEALGVVGVGGF